MMNESETKNVKKGSLPNWAYKAGAVVGILLILAAAYIAHPLFFAEEKNEELNMLEKDSMVFNYDPSGGVPNQLEFILTGTDLDNYRGLVLRKITNSKQYSGLIESGTISNIGRSDLIISSLEISGIKDADKSEVFSGYFKIEGYETDNSGLFQSRFILKKGESAEVRFEFKRNSDGKIAYYAKEGLAADKVFLIGAGKKTGDLDFDRRLKDAMSTSIK